MTNLKIALRWASGIALLGWALYQLRAIGSGADVIGGFAKCLFAFAALVGGTVLLAPELAAWAASPVTRFLNAMLAPSDELTPPVDYTLPRLYRRQMRYTEALERYNHLLSYHPQELNAYLEAIETCFAMDDLKSAHSFYRRCKRKITDPECHAILEEFMAKLVTAPRVLEPESGDQPPSLEGDAPSSPGSRA